MLRAPLSQILGYSIRNVSELFGTVDGGRSLKFSNPTALQTRSRSSQSEGGSVERPVALPDTKQKCDWPLADERTLIDFLVQELAKAADAQGVWTVSLHEALGLASELTLRPPSTVLNSRIAE